MTKLGFLLLVCFCSVGLASAADIALVYENEAAVRQGKAEYGTVVSDGVLVSAKYALANSASLLVGAAGEDLHRAVLVRLDNDLDIAILRLGDVVQAADLNEAFKKKSKAVLAFVPAIVATNTVDQPVPLPPLAAPVGQGWALKINGQPVGKDPIDLKAALKKSKFNVEVVYLSTSPVWSFSFKLTSNPKLAFWKQNRKTSLNDVPVPVLTYDHQALFTPMKEGKSVVLPLEAHFIDEKQEYDWTFEVKSKQDTLVQPVRIKFH